MTGVQTCALPIFSIVKILKIYGKSGKLLAEAKNTITETKTLEKKDENKKIKQK